MPDFNCSSCGQSQHSDGDTMVCASCQRRMTSLSAIATPEAAAQVRVAPPTIAGNSAFSEGTPPHRRPDILPSPTERSGVSLRWVIYPMFGLVVLTLIALLMAALQKVRDAEVRTRSTSHLKQIGLAGHAFHDLHKRLPFNGSAVAVKDERYSLSAVANQAMSGSWGFQLAPFIDQNEMFRTGASNDGVATFMCPGRGRPSVTTTPMAGSSTPPWSDYVINPWLNDNLNGGGLTTTSAESDRRRMLVGITDGTSNTIFFGHGQINTDDYGTTVATPGYMNTVLIGGTTATTLSSNPAAGPVTFARDSGETRRDAARGWGGPFSQGCLMGMCDGTVRNFTYSMGVGAFQVGLGSATSPSSMAAFLTPNGDERDHPWPDP